MEFLAEEKCDDKILLKKLFYPLEFLEIKSLYVVDLTLLIHFLNKNFFVYKYLDFLCTILRKRENCLNCTKLSQERLIGTLV